MLGSPNRTPFTIDDFDCSLDVDICVSLCAFVSPSFEEHSIGIKFQLLRKMGYIKGQLGKSEQGIVVYINLQLHTCRASLTYVVAIGSLSTFDCVEFGKVSLVAGGVQITSLEE